MRPTTAVLELTGDAMPSADPNEPADITVWIARRDTWATSARRGRWLASLDDAELERAQRFRFDADRDTFIAAHGLLRFALTALAPLDPRAWRFATDAHGRPEIVPPSRLRFSLTHTRDLVACAVSLDLPIGLDAEDGARPAPLEAAEHCLSTGEVRQMAALPAPQRDAYFFELWTLKESYSKALGLGLSLGFAGAAFSRDHLGEWRVDPERATAGEPSRWRFWSWRAGHHQLALAAQLEAPTGRQAPEERGPEAT